MHVLINVNKYFRYCIKTKEPLLSLSLRGFIESVGARTSAPGGGSASACVASIGAALGTMVTNISCLNQPFNNYF